MKKKLGLFVLSFILCFVISMENLDSVVLNYVKAAAKKVESVVQESRESVPTICESMYMYLGEKRNLDIAHVGGTSKVSFQSEDNTIVAVAKNGRLTAKNCGQTNIWVRMRQGSQLSQAKIKVVVKYSSFYSSPDYGKKITVDSGNTKAPVLYFHKQLRVGDRAQMNILNTTEVSVIDCVLNPADVVSVSKDGVVKALKTGDATLKTTLKQDGRQYVFCEVYHVVDQRQKAVLSDAQLKEWFHDAGFLGNSISVGLNNYFNTGKEPILGNCPVMARGCYSFANELSSSYEYKVTYQGKAYKAAEAVRISGVNKVFINMGANDIGVGPETAAEQYKSYIENIKKTNPDVMIYIQAMTPVYNPKAVGRFGMDKVNRFNELMQEYCQTQPDLFYIDIASPMMTSDGTLRKDCCSDEFVHLTYTAYEIWSDTVKQQIRTMAVREQKATDAVITYERGKREADYQSALKIVKTLKKGTVRTSLMNRLSKSKAKVKGLLTLQAKTTERLNRPVIASVKAKDNQSVRVTWKEVEGANYYRVYRATTKKGKYKEIKLTKRQTFLDTGLKKNKKYYYKVRACRHREETTTDSMMALAVGCYTRNVPSVEVFAGDSVMSGLDCYQKLGIIRSPGKKYTVAQKGLGTLTFQTKSVFANETRTGVEQILAYHPDRLYIKLGMNELSYADLDNMYDNYADILAQIQDESPKTEIVILPIAPTSRSVAMSKTGFQRIGIWNTKLKKLAKEFDVHYYDFTDSFKNVDGYLKYSGGDGIHWTPAGYDKFCALITAYDKKLNR